MEELYRTLSMSIDGIEQLRNECIQMDAELVKSNDTLSKCQQELNELKIVAHENESLMNNMQLNQELLQQQVGDVKDSLQSTSYNGTYLWVVEDVRNLIDAAQSERQISVYSPPFYSSRNGYKMCMRLYLNGDGNARRTHLSLFVVVMRGEYDAVLKWPFSYKITFCLFDQSGQQRHIIDSFRPNVKSNSFEQPQTQMNIASGIPKFFPLSMLQQDENSYVKNDTIFIQCIVDFNDMPKTVLPYRLSLNPGLPEHVQQSMIKAEIIRRQHPDVPVDKKEG
ncbi:unnamed protein product [Didymodactylos carnosus]|uniref:MATH domain-containing protein n=1 Tax=Didymodactylos carnosus TaxID=1234261 RepID=A0A815APW8_9BILA|nr:unnamed protein product [Didymodactylos carnosus]CAF1371541.1 unnamed protein product [Didymodactylos carnosus]CAF4041948.1 unnamed protein product [Didymodactylos carnosus]CAF4180732.1 unnamed protein product [Didymodactylos carnosus]